MLTWIQNYQLFLFDFDGLLVNTEKLHYAAYVEMCARRGFKLPWDFERFCLFAHFQKEGKGLREAVFESLPELYAQEPRWEVLYEEKKAAYQNLLAMGKLELMPGVERLLIALERAAIQRCVVTNSTKQQVETIQENLPLLKTIPHWITRECYVRPKPAPDGYLLAKEHHARPGDKVIGFEDTIRGLWALQAAGIEAVLVCSDTHPQLKEVVWKGVRHVTSLERLALQEGTSPP